VYVPVRLTDSRLAIGLGGRWFPGVHRSASVAITQLGQGLFWTIEPEGDDAGFAVRVAVTVHDALVGSRCEEVGSICLNATVGISPDHAGRLEAARMEPDLRVARSVQVDELNSAFIDGFTSARPAPSYLMSDVGVTWTRAAVPLGLV